VETLKRLLAGSALIAVALVVGFCAAWGFFVTVNAVLPPFRPEDDDTLREFIPVVLTYGTWVLTSLIVVVLGMRWLRKRP
jgi:hypothetical protein